MTIDTRQTIEVRGSRAKLALFLLLGVGMTSLGGVLALPSVVHGDGASLVHAFGIFAALFFGACTIAICRRLLSAGDIVLTLSPEGIRDTRVAAEVIPWTALRGMGTWTLQGQKVLVLDVDPEVEKRLSLTRMARWTRGANAKLGADGLCISASGLEIGYKALLAAATAHAEAVHRQ